MAEKKPVDHAEAFWLRRFAGEALSGILAGRDAKDCYTREQVVRASVDFAQMLLGELRAREAVKKPEVEA